MRIVVLGSSGLIGSRLVARLHQQGHDVVEGSLAAGVNTFTGEGLDQAFAGAQAVVDVTNSPSFEDKAVRVFFERSGRNIIAAEVRAGVAHHVALSVVGTERLQESGYFRGKLAQEALIEASPIPYTILRSTQFFEFVGRIAQDATVGQTVHVAPALVQPIAADEVAAALASVAVSPPANGIVEVAGPERVGLAELIGRFLAKTGDSRQVIADGTARYFGALLNEHSLVPGADARLGAKSFDEWFGNLQPVS
jgi:uncharacterized protein YbjT (DUF2867 family)